MDVLSSKQSTISPKAMLIKRQAKILFSAYRKDDFADPEGFIVQLGIVLESYEDEVIIAVTDPRTGLQRRDEMAAEHRGSGGSMRCGATEASHDASIRGHAEA